MFAACLKRRRKYNRAAADQDGPTRSPTLPCDSLIEVSAASATAIRAVNVDTHIVVPIRELEELIRKPKLSP